MIKGYKCFNKGLITNYNDKLELNKIYHVKDNIKFSQRGFHLCSYLEDTFRYFDTFQNDVDVTEVIGYGNISKYDDEYNGFYDMYSVEFMKIVRILLREDIIKYAINLPEYRLLRFISLYKLNLNEIKLFKKLYYNNKNIINAIMYYQENIKDVYEKEYKIKR